MRAPITFVASLLVLSQLAYGQAAPPANLSIEEAVQFALKNNPTLRGSVAEIRAARAEIGVARSRTLPQLSANGFASKSNMPGILSSPMGFEPQALVLSPEDEFLDLNLTLMAPLYTGGYLSNLVRAAVARERAARAEASGMNAEVAFMVREAYLRALYAAELVRAQQSRLEASEAMVQNAKAQLEVGRGIEASVRRAEAELAEATQELTMAENDRRKMLLDLLEAMGAPLDARVTLTESVVFGEPQVTLDGSIQRARSERGELRAARHRLQSARAQTSSARGSFSPQIYGFAMSDTFRPEDEMGKSSGYTLGISVSVPLLDGGMRRSEISNMRAMEDRARAEVERISLQVEKQVRQAWLDIETAAQNYKTAQTALASAQAAYDVVVLRVETGKSILVERLDALAALTRARANVAQSLYEHRLALARLDRAIGLTAPSGEDK